MITEAELKKIVGQILDELSGKPVAGVSERPAAAVQKIADVCDSGECLPDITEVKISEQILVPNPHNRDALVAMKKTTPARIGVWRAGARYKTETLLRFRADHAAAQDAVFTNVSDECLAKMGVETIQTCCSSKDEFLTRPDLGAQFDDAARKRIKEINPSAPKVLIYIADGLSSTAIEANAFDCFKSIEQGLQRKNIPVGKPFFVKYGRVPAEDAVSEITGADVVCTLIGERPGLVTAESMSAYIAYKATVGMPESRRTVVSNIHNGGTPAVEAGGYIADLIATMLEKKASGLDLKI